MIKKGVKVCVIGHLYTYDLLYIKNDKMIAALSCYRNQVGHKDEEED